MKKSLLTLAIVLGMTLAGMAQHGGGLFERGATAETSNDFSHRDGGLILPSSHGATGDADAPLGGGMAILASLSAAYLMTKKRKED